MRVLMLGWEFPPYFAGGVGIVCYELTKALAEAGTEIIFVMPSAPDDVNPGHLKLIRANQSLLYGKIKTERIDSIITPYITSQEYDVKYRDVVQFKGGKAGALYGRDLLAEVYRFAGVITSIAQEENFDIIHSHDWTTFPAGIALKKAFGKPLVVHVHITEFDKTGGTSANPDIYKIEREGMMLADIVITVSHKVKERCIHSYFIPPEKIKVIHNAAVQSETKAKGPLPALKDKIVLFAGRITLQKGPDYFVEAAKLVLEKNPGVTFIMAGYGDMLPKLIERVADLGIGHKFIFTGFYTREEADKLFSMADVFVMPSVSEPFGLVPFEAQIKKVPTIVSKEAGVSEVIGHCLKVNFWDIEDLAGKILALLEYPPLHEEIRELGYLEAKRASWDKPASECLKIYNELVRPT